MLPLDGLTHDIIHGKGGLMAFEDSWNQQWKRFIVKNPIASPAMIRNFIRQLRKGFGI
jgi:hypothetical protein